MYIDHIFVLIWQRHSATFSTTKQQTVCDALTFQQITDEGDDDESDDDDDGMEVFGVMSVVNISEKKVCEQIKV